MKPFTNLASLQHKFIRSGKSYVEFLRVSAMSAGVYKLGAGATDFQSPHQEDEIYYVISGKGRMRVADEDEEVQAGSVIFVPAKVEHRFHDIEEELTMLVVFAPAES
jgi:mannose-6-phosphate isomerase-like protein (cupin superfamily)